MKSDSRASSINFNTPFKIFGFSIPLSVRVSDQENKNPVRLQIVDQNDPSHKIDRVFAKTYSTEVDWTTGFSLPQFFPTTLKLSPQVSFGNVDGHAYWVRTEQTGGKYVHQSKRFTYGLSMMAQVTAAALASECKVLSHPATVDTIPTDGSREDVVPMSMGAA